MQLAASLQPSWIVVRTRRGCEHLAKANLEEQGYDVYLPLSVEPDAPEPKPFFAGYIFADTEPCDGQWRPIRNTRGVVDVLLTGDHPSIVPERAIDALKRREEAGVIRLRDAKARAHAMEAAAGWAPGTVVRVHEGQFCGFSAAFSRLSAGDRIWVFMDVMGGAVPVELPAESVLKVA